MSIESVESMRLARDLHDGIAQDLVALGYSLDVALASEDIRSATRRELREARFRVDEIISSVRRQIFELRLSSRRELAARIEEAVSRFQSTIPIHIKSEDISPLPEVEAELLPIALELIRNSLTHARATHIEVDLYSLNNRTCLEVRDDGVGGAQVRENRFGLLGISERVAAFGGSFHISHHHGTRATVVL